MEEREIERQRERPEAFSLFNVPKKTSSEEFSGQWTHFCKGLGRPTKVNMMEM
jgi:hypothetical protein